MTLAPTHSSNAAGTAFSGGLAVVAAVEPRVAAAIAGELVDQRASLKLIASENYASPAVLLAMGNWMSDKYAEGTIGRRFYAGCRNVDVVEEVAAEHAKALFGAQHAYVQPHSGIDANLVAFWGVLAARVEAPALRRASAQHVNDLTDARLGLAPDAVRRRLAALERELGARLVERSPAGCARLTAAGTALAEQAPAVLDAAARARDAARA